MNDPLSELGLPPDCDDEMIRRRYLELVRKYPPDHHPEKFNTIRAAYEALRDPVIRLRKRLFEAGKRDSIEAIIEELQCQTSRRRMTLTELVQKVLRS